MPRTVIPAALDIIKDSEKLKLVAYLCPSRVPTWGYGHTKGVTMEDVRLKRKCTTAQANAWLRDDVAESAEDVESLLRVDTSDEEFGAMVSLHFNIGGTQFRKSTVLRKHNAGDKTGAARAFALWNKDRNADGVLVELRGLTKRRSEEAALYLTQSDDAEAVDPLRTRGNTTVSAHADAPAVDRTGAGATVAGTGGMLQMAANAIQQAEPAMPLVQSALQYAPWVVGLLITAGIGLIVWHKLDQRRERM